MMAFAITGSGKILMNNGFQISATNGDIIEVATKVNENIWDNDELEKWFRQHFAQ
jgi:prophage maintenance system killer protein